MKALAKEKDMLEREKWDLRRQTKEATEQVNILRAQMDMKENRVKELEAELTMVRGHKKPHMGGCSQCCCLNVSLPIQVRPVSVLLKDAAVCVRQMLSTSSITDQVPLYIHINKESPPIGWSVLLPTGVCRKLFQTQ